jgi:dipeptidyl aminopeptidase/acylaminoacyl peptidase
MWMTSLAAALAAPAAAQSTTTTPAGVTVTQPPTKLIPRAALFGNPDRTSPQISPDGKWISYVAPLNGVLNVWVAPADKIDQAKAITKDTGRGIRQAFFAFDNAHVIYLQDQGGDENWKVHSVNIQSGVDKDLTPFDSIPGPDGKPLTMPNNSKLLRPSAQIQQLSPKSPGVILIGLNNRNPQYHDIYRVNVATGESKLVQQNDEYGGFVTDDDFAVRLAMKPRPDGGQEVLIADGKGGFAPFMTIANADSLTTQPLGFDKANGTVYMLDSRGRDTSAVKAINLATKAESLLAEDPRADAQSAVIHPTAKTVQAVLFNYDRVNWKVVDKAIEEDLAYLKTVSPGEISIDDRSLDDSRWVVSYTLDNGPAKWYLYDRAAKKAGLLFVSRKALEGLSLATMKPVVIKSRDGLNLVSYLTLPVGADANGDGVPEKPLPMVLNVHGGPWARDTWGYRGEVQWLANRGYAVLQVNYRGSTGFGKSFLNAANKEWGGKMHEDLVDAVKWAVDGKVADPARVAIYGGSYGGYATLVGMTFTPELFACGVDIVGVSNLNTFLSTIPPYWHTFLDEMKVRLGDFTSEDGKKFLASRSPVNFVDRIKKPLLIAQGYNDPRVNHDESLQMVRVMEARNIPVTYVVYPDEGHGFARPENRTSFYAVAEAFLAANLGGTKEQVGKDFAGSTITVPNGADHIPGLTEALGSVKQK